MALVWTEWNIEAAGALVGGCPLMPSLPSLGKLEATQQGLLTGRLKPKGAHARGCLVNKDLENPLYGPLRAVARGIMFQRMP